MSTTTRLVVVRHGEAQCSVDSVVGGMKGCTGLSSGGRTQAELLRDRLLATGELAGTDVVLTSTLPRAIETAEVIAPGLGAAGDMPAKQDADLCELLPGAADGITWADYNERFGHIDMRANLYAPIAPGGESIAEFVLRIGRTMSRLLVEHEGRSVVIVAHGGVVWASAQTFLHIAVAPHTWVMDVTNTSLTEWRIADGTTHLVRFNDAAHLQPTGSTTGT